VSFAASGQSSARACKGVKTLVLTGVRALDHGLGEVSGIAALPGGGFLLVEDEHGVALRAARADRVATFIAESSDHPELRGLEGICLGIDGRTAYVVSEDHRGVLALALEGRGAATRARVAPLGRLPDIARRENKGWEGVAVLPARHSPDGADRLAAVHEDSPRRVGLFRLPDLEAPILLRLPRELEDELEDLSDVAVEPRSGHLFLLSDQSAAVAEVALEAGGLRALALARLPDYEELKLEGLDFDRSGRLWLAAERHRAIVAHDVGRA